MRGARRTWFLAGLLACLGLAGCRNRDVLENELRARDMQYREAVDELKKAEFQNEALQRELDALRRGSKIGPEEAARTFGLKNITLGRRTMGVDNDKLPGDEALQVILEPHDVDDHIVKAPGTLQVIALEISPQGNKSLLSSWDLDQNQMRRAWKQGLFGGGYEFILPWKSWPQYENVRVMARLTLSDGRVFEADKDIKIRIPAGLKPRPELPPGEPLPPPEIEVGKWTPANPGPNVAAQWQPADQGSTVTHSQSCRWQPAPLQDSIQLGRPEPVEPAGPGQ